MQSCDQPENLDRRSRFVARQRVNLGVNITLCQNVCVARQKDACNVSRQNGCNTRKTSREMWIVVIIINDEAERSHLVIRAWSMFRRLKWWRNTCHILIKIKNKITKMYVSNFFYVIYYFSCNKTCWFLWIQNSKII